MKNIYSYEDAYTATLNYFNNDELAAKVWVDKYALRDNDKNLLEKTPTDMHWRLAKEFARIEKAKFKKPLSEEEIFYYLDKFKYIVPQGGILYGLGNSYQYISISNCFALTSPSDSYGGICSTDEELVQISKRRGGCGINLSLLRPHKSPTKNSSRTSTGPKSFAKRYSRSIREVGQDGRRGALLMMMADKHPDIIDFIQSKLKDTEITGANLSVAISDALMKAAGKNKEYTQQWPIDSDNPKIIKKVPAKEILDAIAQTSWQSAEPGALFWDTIIRESIGDCYAEYGYATVVPNPCQPAWATVLTPKGITEIRDINIGDKIWSETGWTTVTNKQSTGIKSVYRYRTTSSALHCTSNHKVKSQGCKVEINACNSIDRLSGCQTNSITYIPEVIMDGIVLGDGSVHKASNDLVHLHIGDKDHDYFSSEIAFLITKHRPGLSDTSYEIQTSITAKELPYTYYRGIPDRFKFGDSNIVKSFLKGLFSANGSVIISSKGGRVALKATSKRIIDDVQLMLSSIGIASYYTTNKETKTKFKHGKTYLSKESYDLNIAKDIKLFCDNIGFVQQYKQRALEVYVQNKKESVKSAKVAYNIIQSELISVEEVWALTVDNIEHTYWSDGCNICNCGELPLPSLDSCRLLLLNLFSYVAHPFTKDAYFDYSLFYQHSQIAQRLMDDIVDLELECVQRIINKITQDPEDMEYKHKELATWKRIMYMCKNGRRTGSGHTALADALAALDIKYGSDKALKEVDKIAKTFKFGCYRSSVDMAKELGPFPIWEHELEKDNPFLNRIKNEKITLHCCSPGLCEEWVDGQDLWNDMKKYGRRNIACLTLSPAGTISVETQTTSGGEPLLYFSQKRRKKGNLTDENFRCDFTDKSGDKWMEFEFDHPKLTLWKQITGKTKVEDSPWYGCCAEDLDYLARIKTQAILQKHIDHSISSTINLPENTTVETVSKIYEEAWKHGLKGVTIYRKGCRAGVILDNSPTVIERPRELPCDVYHVAVKGQSYFVLVGMMNNSPFEIFAGKNGSIDAAIKTGKIIRKKKGFYKAIFEEDDTELSPITSFSTETEEAITRLVSTSLRAKVDLNLLVTQLEKVGGNSAEIHGFAKVLSRVLKKYIKDGEEIQGETCPDCQSPLVRKEGCWSCLKCSYSKCS